MATPTLTFSCWNYDRVRPLLDGRVQPKACQIAPCVLPSSETFPRAVADAPFDISELSLSSYLLQVSRGEGDYVALPVFPSRGFRHGAVYVRTDAGIETPKDLEGRLVGVPEYQMTLALWVRGILQDEYGVDLSQLRYRTAGLDAPGRRERLPLKLPAHMDVAPATEGSSLNEMLLAGEIDAIMSPGPPRAFVEGNPRVRRLVADTRAAEQDYHRRTGFFPILHIVGLRRRLAEAQPELAADLFRAFVEAKRIAVGELDTAANAGANPVTLPWFADALAETRALMGSNFWSYGVPANRAELETICRYSLEQHLSERRLDVGELFAPQTMDLADC